ncbi:hypothetical protein Baya_1214 [Bagarius yarrelli]|uniref:Uncharacterized protein n=1 Tax=Bagarius yarrelli TaxID=175774 RepID=A0A556TKI8_BAGYA|nr:hypothetical protein Baya_1214 [Bagarius yarrelli]
MESYKRFNDVKYKHWLQATESLYILRSHIRQFVENETEIYHKSLREQLKDCTCTSKCSLHKCSTKLKKFPICENCERWKDAILRNHNQKGIDIPWNNCQPHLWPTDKWEVAKVYMIRGVKNHHSFDQFDISAILNFMHHCKHFKAFTESQYLTKVINVRNKVMHSPDFSLSKEEMDDALKYVQELAKILEQHEPGLKTVSEKIQQFKGILEKWGGQTSQSTEDGKKESLKLLNREQNALREKIEFLAQCYENGQGTELKIQEELQGMKNFLERNKDLLENLGPQVRQLNEIQEKVNKHDQDIDKLNTRVNQLETGAPDPVFSGDVLRFKNHLLEEARKRNMPEPEFTEEREQYGTIYFGTVTVVFKNQEVVSDICDHAEEASESAYKKLACQFGLMLPEAPLENSVCQDDKTLCKLQISGSFTFHDKDGSSKKKQAEQQAAKVALHNLSGILNCRSLDNAGDNWKGFLKERLEALGLQKPDYDFKNVCIRKELEEASTADDSSQISMTKVNSKNYSIQSKIADSEAQNRPAMHTADSVDRQKTETLDSSLSEISNQPSKTDSSGTIYYGVVTVFLENQEVVSDGCVQEGEATESAYRKVACLFGLKPLEGKKEVLEHFQKCDFPPPLEHLHCEDNKFFCKLILSGSFTFSDKESIYYGIVTVFLNNQEVISDGCIHQEEAIQSSYRNLAYQFGLMSTEDGSSKKKQAEQQAAKVALQHLSGLFNCKFEEEAGKNYKGFLKEQLDALHLQCPVYKCKKKGEIGEEIEIPSKCGANSQYEKHASMLVKQDFSQKSLTLPKEVFKGNKCSLDDITYNLVYDGEGSTETEAELDALHKALDRLTLLFGFNSLPKCSTVEETKQQINSLLKTKGQKDLIYSPKHNLYKSSIELLFKDYTMERKHKNKKQENVNHLSKCILDLLAVDTDPNMVSLRNCLDDWFKQKNLKQPVFENTEKAHGSKVTFSVQVSCSSPSVTFSSSVRTAQSRLF